MQVYIHSLKGEKHRVNQDCYRSNDEKGLYMIADGMGGYLAGEVASKIACDCIESNIDDFSSTAILCAIEKANTEIYTLSREEKYKGMGTTAAVCMIKNNKLIAAHVGDSRIYIYDQNKLRAVTKDHSYVEELISSGEITRQQANSHAMRNVITRAIGAEQKVVADLFDYTLTDEDIILLCSDGLSTSISDEELLQTLSGADIEKLPKQLCDMAVSKGCTDDVTVMMISSTRGWCEQ